MKSRDLLPCPLCGTSASITRLKYNNGDTRYNISCGIADDDSDTCGLVLYGSSKDKRGAMVLKWNRRALLHEDD